MSTEPTLVVVADNPPGEPVLSLSLTCHGDVKVIVINGELDLATCHLLTEFVDRVAADRPARFVIDMAGVTFFCAAGLSALLRVRETVTAAGGRLVLRAPSRSARLVLTITDTDRLFLTETAPAAA